MLKPMRRLWSNGICVMKQTVLLMLLSICLAPVLASAHGSKHSLSRTYASQDKLVTHTYTLADFGYHDAIRMRGIYDIRKVNFGIRLDESVVDMQVKLYYSMSPALLKVISHLNIKINGFPVRSLTVGGLLERHGIITVKIDPNLLQEYNQLAFEFIGHYTYKCEDPAHSSLWAVIGKKTQITLHALKLRTDDSLALLPYPFFDKHDNSRLHVPFVFAGKPTPASLKASGILASWFGKMADYRGTSFPVLSGELPVSGNAIVLMSGKNQLQGVDIRAPVDPDHLQEHADLNKPDPNNPYDLAGPTIVIRHNPNDPYGLLLIVSGRNDAEMIKAAQALVLGHVVLAGHRALVAGVSDPIVRRPYDAPRWLPDNRPVRFAELSGKDELQVQGVWPGPVRVNFRMPPDLFHWHGYEPRLHLKYRYSIVQKTERQRAERARLNVKFNGQFLESYPLVQDTDEGWRYWMLAARSLVTGDTTMYEKLKVPATSFQFHNQFQFHFLDLRMDDGECKQIPSPYFEGQIDPQSTIDISHTPHFARMPDIGMFVNGGFPFTRMADLSDTAVVLPDAPDADTISSFLKIMGMMGASTGFPAVHVEVIDAYNVNSGDMKQYADKDFLVIGALGKNSLLKRWDHFMPVVEENGKIGLKEPNSFQFLGSLFSEGDRRQGGEILLRSSDHVALLTSFESPLKDGHTVVVVTSTKNNMLNRLANQMTLLPAVRSAHGDTLIMTGDDTVSSLNLADSYYVGKIPLWAYIQWLLSNSPLMLLLLVVVAITMLGMLLYIVLHARARRRLYETGEI